VLVGHATQFPINNQHHLIARAFIAIAPGFEQLRYWVWRGIHTEVSLKQIKGLKLRDYTPSEQFPPSLQLQPKIYTGALEVSARLLAL
jgi:hypothetical protein